MNVKSLVLLLALFVSSTALTFASGNKNTNKQSAIFEDETPSTARPTKAILSVQPFSLIAGGLDLAYEQKFTSLLTARINFGYFLSADPIGYDDSFSDMDGFRAELQLRRYVFSEKHQTPNGVYIAPYGLYRQISMMHEKWVFDPIDGSGTSTIVKEVASAASGGLLIGIQFVTKSRITLDMFAGGGVFLPIDDTSSDEAHLPVVNPYKKTIAPKLGFSVGLAL